MPKRLVLLLACSLGVAACGASSDNQTKDPGKSYSQALAYSKCMRSHGVSNFPDPSTHGNTIQLTIGPNSARSPAFQSAQSACRHVLPGGGPGGGPPSAQAKAQLLAVSECMRAHGITGFPDPTTNPPSDSAGNVAVMGRNGVFLAIPNSIDTKSPAFQQAAAACHFGPRGGRVRTL